jgi:hypothetical protein
MMTPLVSFDQPHFKFGQVYEPVLKDSTEHSLRRPIFEERLRPVTFRIEYRASDGRTLTTGW